MYAEYELLTSRMFETTFNFGFGPLSLRHLMVNARPVISGDSIALNIADIEAKLLSLWHSYDIV